MDKPDKPNILVIWGDDIGVYNMSAYHRGLMGGSTPNIDRIANEGVLFTDHYPAKWPKGRVINDIFSQEDWFPTLLAAAGEAGYQGETQEGP